MSQNHKELYLSPSGKIPYLLQGVDLNTVVSTHATSFETGALAAPGVKIGTDASNSDWIMVAPMGDLGENFTCLNGARVLANDQIAVSFGNWGATSGENETLNNSVDFPILALAIHPPEIIVAGTPPIQKSDFRKSPSGRLIMCYEKITVPSVALTANATTVQNVPSECASRRQVGNVITADYIFAFPLTGGTTAILGSSYAFNYAIAQQGSIDLHFLTPASGAANTVGSDWLFLIIKNDGTLGTANGGV